MAVGQYTNLTPKMALQLAAPHTWAASVTPVILTGAIVFRETGTLDALLFLVLLIICILMQSAVNTFNDYYDMVRGHDSKEDAVEASDAVLVYNNVPPRKALYLGVGFLLFAALLSAYPVYKGGLPVLAIGIAGALIIVLYSAGPKPISHLPLGELVSGFVMGSLIPLGCYTALTQTVRAHVMLHTLPVALGIAYIMMTNNTCDIEKDMTVGRRTFPVLLGRNRAVRVYRVLMAAWVTLTGIYIIVFLPRFSTLRFPVLLLAVAALIVFHLGMILTFRQARAIADAKKRPVLMKRISVTTFVYGVSLTLAMVARM